MKVAIWRFFFKLIALQMVSARSSIKIHKKKLQRFRKLSLEANDLKSYYFFSKSFDLFERSLPRSGANRLDREAEKTNYHLDH